MIHQTNLRNGFGINSFVRYADGTICIEDKLWFDENLKAIEKKPIVYDNYILSDDMILEGLRNAGLDDLAKDASYMFTKGCVGEILFVVFTRDSEVESTEYIFDDADVYFSEMDIEGNILAVVHIEGMNYSALRAFVPL